MSHFMFLSDVAGPRWVIMGMVVKLAQSVSLTHLPANLIPNLDLNRLDYVSNLSYNPGRWPRFTLDRSRQWEMAPGKGRNPKATWAVLRAADLWFLDGMRPRVPRPITHVIDSSFSASVSRVWPLGGLPHYQTLTSTVFCLMILSSMQPGTWKWAVCRTVTFNLPLINLRLF